MLAEFDRFELECDLSDLERMSNLAVSITHDVIGETRFKYSGDDGKVYEVVSHNLSPDNVSDARFAIFHLRDMIQALQKKYIEGAA